MEWIILWLILFPPDLKGMARDFDKFIEPLVGIIRFIRFIGFLAATIWGIYIWFNGFWGIQFTGFYRLTLGLVIWPASGYFVLRILVFISNRFARFYI